MTTKKTKTTSKSKKTPKGLNIRVVKKDTKKPKSTAKKRILKKTVKTASPKKTIKKLKTEKKIKPEEPVAKQHEIEETVITNREEIYYIHEQVEHNKKIIMWSGVTFFTILIVFFWIISMKQNIKQTNVEIQTKSAATIWNEKAEQLDYQITEMNSNLEKINTFTKESKENIKEIITDNSQTEKSDDQEPKTITEDDKTSETKQKELSEEEILEIKEKIKELEAKLQ